LSVHEMQAHLRRITYRPGWRFDLYPGAWEGPHLEVLADVPDADGMGELVTVSVVSAVPPMDTLDQFERWLGWRLARIESHEMREFLKRDGVAIYDPHAPDAHRDLA
jgi:hypothetical protein